MIEPIEIESFDYNYVYLGTYMFGEIKKYYQNYSKFIPIQRRRNLKSLLMIIPQQACAFGLFSMDVLS